MNEKMTIYQALVAAQSRIHAAGKSGENTYDHYTYAMLQDYCNAIHEPMTENGLALSVSVDEVIDMPDRTTSQGKTEHAVRVKLRGVLSHISGETLEFFGYGEGQDRADKGLYKAITGGKKYLIADIFNVPTTDDPETDSHEDFDKPPAPAGQTANKPRQASPTQTPSKAPPPAGRPASGKDNPKSGQPGKKTASPYAVNEKEQKERGCINTTLVAELRLAVLAQEKLNLLDPTKEFLPWLEKYLTALYEAPDIKEAGYVRKHTGTAQILLDIPSTRYKEILERVKNAPQSCKPVNKEEQDDSGVA